MGVLENRQVVSYSAPGFKVAQKAVFRPKNWKQKYEYLDEYSLHLSRRNLPVHFGGYLDFLYCICFGAVMVMRMTLSVEMCPNPMVTDFSRLLLKR